MQVVVVTSWAETSTLNFLVRGSCRVHSVPIYFEARSRIAPGTGVHCVRQRSGVDLVEKSACIENGRQHLGHVAEGRDRECRKGRVHQVFNRSVRNDNDAQTSSNRGTESCRRRRSNEVLHNTPRRGCCTKNAMHL